MSTRVTMPPGVHRSLALEIRTTWRKLSETDLDHVHNTDELAEKVAKAYSVPMPKAVHDVQAWAQGRRF